MNNTLKGTLVALGSALLFFALVFSNVEFLPKIVGAIAILAVSGIALRKIMGWEGFYALSMVRSKKGFEQMEYFALKHRRVFEEGMDLGLTLMGGIFYSYYVFQKDKMKWAVHALCLLAFFFAFAFVLSNSPMSPVVLALGMAFGLFGVGFFLIAMQALTILSAFFANGTTAGTAAGVSLAIPGLGLVPLFEGVIAIAFIAVVHELAHGIMCYIKKLEVKSSGVLLFGFLPIGAFVEPNEEKFKKIPIHAKRSILVAGSAINLFFFMVFVVLFSITNAGVPQDAMQVNVVTIAENSALKGFLEAGDVITGVDGKAVHSISELSRAMQGKKAGDSVVISSNKGDKRVTVLSEGKLGFTAEEKQRAGLGILEKIYLFGNDTIFWLWYLNLAIAIFNILPVFITDGQRMVTDELEEALGKKRKALAHRISLGAGVVMVLIILANALPHFA